MFKNYFKIALRNLWKHKVFSLISLAGLATGIASCLLILYFINYERSFDAFQNDNVYRLIASQQKENADAAQKVARTMFPMGPTLKATFPEIKEYARIISMENVPLQTAGKTPFMATWCGTDNSFLGMFNFKLQTGDSTTALKEPNSIVITQRLSRRLFGTEDPIGKAVSYQGRDTTDYMVTGVLEDIPARSHLQFDALYTMSPALIAEESTNWTNDWMTTYVQIEEDTDIKKLEAKFPDYLNEHMGTEKASHYQVSLQPIKDIHLWSSTFTQDALNKFKFNGNYLFLLAFIAFLVLMLAIMNYVNLTTVQAMTRAKEVAIRKTIGANKLQVTIQFLGETLLLSVLSLLLAFALVAMIFPLVNQFSDRNMTFHIIGDPFWIRTGGCIVLGTGLLAGLIPAMALADLRPVRVLKGVFWKSHKSILRNALAIAQFSIAIVLSVTSFIAYKQLTFMMKYDMGFNKNEVLVTQISWTERQRVEALMNELRSIPGVVGVTGSLRRIGDPIDQNEVIFQDGGKTHNVPAATMFVDYNYISFYDIKLIDGRNLSRDYGSDAYGNSYLINESMAKKLLSYAEDPKASLNSLIGKKFRYSFQDSLGTIVGITSDFNINSLHHRVEPLCLTYQYDYYFKELSIRINRANPAKVLSLIEGKWKDMLPDRPLDYHFLYQQFDQLYKTDKQVNEFVAVLTILAILISCLGLIGLAVYNTERRVKEIGLRKILGGSVQSIVVLLLKDFMRLVLIAILIATPVAVYIVYERLQDYAYRVQMSWWIFAIAGMLAILITLLTVSFQAIKAATDNPVKSLRTE